MHVRAGAAGLGFAAILALFGASHDPRSAVLVWNVTASAPIGLYRVMHAAHAQRGDLVLVWPPDWVQHFASERHYLPLHVPMVKRIAAVMGEHVCAWQNTISIDGKIAATRLSTDGVGRALPAWEGCHVLRADEVFLLMKNVKASFDGRYFGVVSSSSILGRLLPLWTH